MAKAKAVKLRITNHAHDFETRIRGDVAWVIGFIDREHVVDSEAARAFTPPTNQMSQVGHHAVKGEVLVKTRSGWKIALAHTSTYQKTLELR